MTDPALTSDYYRRLLTDFAERGLLPGASPDTTPDLSDPLMVYVVETLLLPGLGERLSASTVAQRIFVDQMMQFVSLSLSKAAYRRQRLSGRFSLLHEARLWTPARLRDGLPELLQLLRTYRPDSPYLAAEGLPSRLTLMPEDAASRTAFFSHCTAALTHSLRSDEARFIAEQGPQHRRLLLGNLERIPAYLAHREESEAEFFQAWALLGGRWNTVEYERLLRTVRLQKRYPVLETVAHQMGRTADPQGKRRLSLDHGHDQRLPTASRSDIVGISLGNTPGALLPTELAQMLDPDLESLFLKKYVTAHLQVFESRSLSLGAARRLHTRPARPLGPMVICCDTSGSMQGRPGEVMLSLMMRLAEVAQTSRRECLLIAFADHARPINVLDDRTALLHFFSRPMRGGTDAHPVLDLLERSLHDDPRYAGADVLWISDFRIPRLDAAHLRLLHRLRRSGLRFLGLQLGIAENHWTSLLDEMYLLPEVRSNA